MTNYDRRHGGAWDRGSADAYYRRDRNHHKYDGPTGFGAKIKLTDQIEIDAYNDGYDTQEDHKDWG